MPVAQELPSVQKEEGGDNACYRNDFAVALAQAAVGGPVIGLATAGGGRLYSLCQGPAGGMKVWDQLDLSCINNGGGWATVASAKIWKKGRPRKLKEEASAMAVSGDWVAASYRDNKIRLYRLGNTHHQLLSAAAPAGQLQYSGSLPSRAEYLKNWAWGRKYAQVRRHHSRPWMDHADAISTLAFSSAGHGLLYSASWDKSVKVWSLRNMACLESFKAHDDAINAMFALDDHPSCSSSGGLGLLFTASADESIKVWSRRKLWGNRHALVVALQGHSAAVNALALARQSQSPGRSCCIRLYSGGSDGRIMLWSSSCKLRHKNHVGHDSGASCGFSMELQETLPRGHKKAVLCLELVQLPQQADSDVDQFLLVSGSTDKTIRLWSEDTSMGGAGHQCIAVLAGHGAHAAPVKSLHACTLRFPAKIHHYLHGYDHQDHDRGTSSARHVLLYSGDLDGCIKMWLLSCRSIQSTDSTAAAVPADSRPVKGRDHSS